MNWFNFYIPKIRSDRFAEATDEQIGAWFRLVTYCCDQENGGLIECAKTWTDRKWRSVAGVEQSVVMAESPLWHFTAIGSLAVYAYPEKMENTTKAQRKGGKRGAHTRWAKNVIPLNPTQIASSAME